MKKKVFIIALILVIFVVAFIGYFYFKKTLSDQNPILQINPNLKKFTLSELAQYNGDDPTKPIYMGLDGMVYDVSEGIKYYGKNGGYHYLAGRDSSEDLHSVMVDGLIKKKYPIVGFLSSK